MVSYIGVCAIEAIASPIVLPITNLIVRYVVRNNIYETQYYTSDYHIRRDYYEKLSLLQKSIKAIAQICLATLAIALLHTGIAEVGRFVFNVNREVVLKFALIGAIMGAIFGLMYEPRIGDWYYYNIGPGQQRKVNATYI